MHCVRLGKDNLVYVCDRMNNRIQVFKKNGEFVRQFVFESATRGSGLVWDLVPSEDPSQKYLLVADGTNNEALITCAKWVRSSVVSLDLAVKRAIFTGYTTSPWIRKAAFIRRKLTL